MKLTLRQKTLKLMDTFEMTDETGRMLFSAKGRISIGKRVDLLDSLGESVGYVRERLVDLLPHYMIYEGDEHIGDIVKDLSVVRDRFSFTFSKWVVKADLVGFSYEILEGRRVVAKISRRAVRVVHPVYDIEIADDADTVRVLLAVMAILAMSSEKDYKDNLLRRG